MSIQNVIFNMLSLPTVPLRESWVRGTIATLCKQNGLPFFSDRAGNLWVNASSPEEIKSSKLVFVAHMDHPGITIDNFYMQGSTVISEGQWHGGGPARLIGQPVMIFSDFNAGTSFLGTIVQHSVKDERPGKVVIKSTDKDNDWAKLSTETKRFGPWGACLFFSEIPNGVSLRKDIWRTKAADDLISVSVILDSLIKTAQTGVIALFTTDEEEGMNGAYAALNEHIASPDTVAFSIEVTDYSFAGVQLGNGPIIRYGDSETQFTLPVIEKITDLAKAFQGQNTAFRYQIQGTSKGVTEGTAFSRYQFPIGGLSLALKNYHNKAPNGEAVPEEVSATDVNALSQFLPFLIQNWK